MVFDDKFFLPDTFRHHQMRRLSHSSLVSVDPHTARLGQTLDGPPRHLDGRFFYFDTEYPGHFGHVVTEVLSRFAAWRQALRLAPDLRPLISLDPGQTVIPAFQRTIFAALGVDPDTVAYIRPSEIVSLDSLYAGTPDYEMPRYAAPELRQVWAEVGERVMLPNFRGPERIFVSRRGDRLRNCHQHVELELFFAGEGFAVIYPEEHDFSEQVSMFRSARVLAGYAGSGMFTAMFAGASHQILIAPDTYTAKNEFLIASPLGGSIDLFWGLADNPHPRGGWRWSAYQSDYRFDLDAQRTELLRAIERAADAED